MPFPSPGVEDYITDVPPIHDTFGAFTFIVNEFIKVLGDKLLIVSNLTTRSKESQIAIKELLSKNVKDYETLEIIKLNETDTNISAMFGLSYELSNAFFNVLKDAFSVDKIRKDYEQIEKEFDDNLPF